MNYYHATAIVSRVLSLVILGVLDVWGLVLIGKGTFTKMMEVKKMGKLRRGAFYNMTIFSKAGRYRVLTQNFIHINCHFCSLGYTLWTICYLDYSFCFFQCIWNQFPWQPHPWSTLTSDHHYHLNYYKQWLTSKVE